MRPRKIGAFLLSMAILFCFCNIYLLPATADTGINPMVSVGRGYVIMLKSDGTAWAWGINTEKQLGNGSVTTNQKAEKPIAVTMPTDSAGDPVRFLSVSAGWSHVLALATDGSVWGWGSNSGGQLGIDLVQSSVSTPTRIASDFGGVPVVAVVAGNCVSYALRSDGTVYSWGSNEVGLLGNGEGATSPQLIPQRIEALDGIVRIYAGENNAAALTAGGRVILWGDNGSRQCGVSDQNPVYVPQTEKAGTYTATAVALGEIHTTFLSVDARVTSLQNFGLNSYGQYGLGRETNPPVNTKLKPTTLPTDLSGTPVAIAAGSKHMLMLTDSGAVYAWGNNQNQQLGVTPDNDAVNQYTPKRIVALESAEIVSIDAAYDLGVALDASGAVYVWGTVSDSETGNETPTLMEDINGGLFNLGAPSVDREYTVFVSANATVPRPTYTVSIPSTIEPDALHQKRTDAPDNERISVTEFSVSAMGISNFFGEKWIEVRLSADGDGFYLTDASNHVIEYKVYNTADGETPFSSGEIFATFRESGSATSTQTVTGRIEIDQSDIQFSGEYEDRVIFTVTLMPQDSEGGDAE